MLRRTLNNALRVFGQEITSVKWLQAYREELKFYQCLSPSLLLYSQLPQEAKELISPYLPYSKAQLAQDLFALAIAGTTAPKFFVEFGATDGVDLSNTWLLEKKLGWNGILAEPAIIWHDALKSNRSCAIETKCVARESNQKFKFLEVTSHPELSGVEEFADTGDRHSSFRLANSQRFEVDTISLDDLLDTHNAPGDIQFLSIDTEGSEFDILEVFDFSRRKIRSISVEHNYVVPRRQSIHALLIKHGYKQVFERISKFDDWYVLDLD